MQCSGADLSSPSSSIKVSYFTEGHSVVLYLHMHAKFENNYFLSAWMVWFLFMVYDWRACVSIVLYRGSFSALYWYLCMNETAHYDEWTNQHNKNKKVFVRPGDNGKLIFCLMSEFLYFPRLQRDWTKIKRTNGLCLNFYRFCVLCSNFCIFPCFQLSWTKIKRSYIRISIQLTTCVWISIIAHVSCGSGQKLKDLIQNFHRSYVLCLGFYIYLMSEFLYFPCLVSSGVGTVPRLLAVGVQRRELGVLDCCGRVQTEQARQGAFHGAANLHRLRRPSGSQGGG